MGAEEPEPKPEFIEKMGLIAKQKSIRVDDFAKRYGLKDARQRVPVEAKG
ncbi:hypothetical protein HYU16_05085 [Candidatus Woesearchaeota archaeon]|nr:hypothetical protein [Candidatus Woesearchaeota archaeon]